jgi:hypothetical protein
VCDDIESSPIVVSRRRTIAASQCIVVDSMQEDKSVHISRHIALSEPGDSIEETFLSSNVANSILETKANQLSMSTIALRLPRLTLYGTNKVTFKVCFMMGILRGNLYFTDVLR